MANKIRYGCLLAVTVVALVAVKIWPGDVAFQVETQTVSRAPLYDMVSGEGIIASAHAGLAAPEYASRLVEVYVTKDQQVAAEQPLFRVDTYALEAELVQTLAMKAAYMAGAQGDLDADGSRTSGGDVVPGDGGDAAPGDGEAASGDGGIAGGSLPPDAAQAVDALLGDSMPVNALDASGALLRTSAVYASQCAALAQAMDARSHALTEAIARGTVRATQDGRVLEVYARSGSLLAAGQGVLALDDGALCAQVPLSSRDRARVRAGQRCVVSIYNGGARLGGEVESVSAGAMEGSYTAKVILDAADVAKVDPPRIGDRVDVDILANLSSDALVLPLRALTGSGEGVFVAHEGRAVFAPVRLGLTTRAGCEVLDGLKSGEQVILDPPDGMKHGDRVVTRK